MAPKFSTLAGLLGGLLGSLPAVASEGGGAAMDALLKPEPGTIVWTLIIFGVLLLVLGKFAWKPILKAAHEREERIRLSVERADAARAEAEKALEEHKLLSAKNRAEAADILKRAREDAERAGADILARARREADEQVKRAEQQIEEERVRAVESIRREAVDLALAAAGQLLQKSLDQPAQRAFVEQVIRELPGNLKNLS